MTPKFCLPRRLPRNRLQRLRSRRPRIRHRLLRAFRPGGRPPSPRREWHAQTAPSGHSTSPSWSSFASGRGWSTTAALLRRLRSLARGRSAPTRAARRGGRRPRGLGELAVLALLENAPVEVEEVLVRGRVYTHMARKSAFEHWFHVRHASGQCCGTVKRPYKNDTFNSV